MMEPVTAYLGLGGNLGHPEETIRKALTLLEESGAVEVRAISSFYRTEPIGMANVEGETIPWFVNAVAEIDTMLSPQALLELCLSIEHELGRDRCHHPAYTGALSRTVDVDILFYGDSVIRLPELIVPHPRVHERGFTLVPLKELAADLVHPELGMTIERLAQTVENQTDIKVLESLLAVH